MHLEGEQLGRLDRKEGSMKAGVRETPLGGHGGERPGPRHL